MRPDLARVLRQRNRSTPELEMSELSHKEWKRLLFYCAGNEVARCLTCGRRSRQHEFTDSADDRTCVCPGCRADVTEIVRAHLFTCGMRPSSVRRRSITLCESAGSLVEESQRLLDSMRRARPAD